MKKPITRICNRTNTTENWRNDNPLLLQGEIGVEFTVNNKTKVKIGNGKDTWNDLKYISTDTSLIIDVDADENTTNIDNVLVDENKDTTNIDKYAEEILNIREELKFTQIALISLIIMLIITIAVLIYILAF